MRYILPYIFGILMLFSCANSNAGKASSGAKSVSRPPKIREYRLEVVAEYPHDVTSYTQGLFFHEGQLYETTGQYGSSTLRMVDLETGNAIERQNFDDEYFVEGSVVFGDELYVLTWQEKVVFVYDARTLEYKDTRRYPREGWGLTTDGNELIASDGTAFLYFMDKNLKVKRKVQVKAGHRAVHWLNELEYIGGKIWANVYTSDEIAIINPSTGYVEAVIDCRGLLPEELHTYDTDVLNGIAYNPQTGRLYLTGKNWPKIYQVNVVEKK